MSKNKVRKERSPDHGNETLIEFHRELHRFTHQAPSERTMLLVAHGFLEVMVNMLVEAKLRNGKKVVSERQNYSHAIKLLLLNEVGVINDELYEHLDFLRDLRNSAAHSAFFQLASSDHDRVKRFLDETGPVSPDSSNLVQFNIFFSRTVGWLWNAHTEVFGPTLA